MMHTRPSARRASLPIIQRKPSLYLNSLFQVMTLESWSNGIVRQLIEEEGWWVGFYFVIFIFMTTFTFLNMFVAIFTNTVVALEADSEEGINSEVRKIQSQLDVLVDEIKPL